MRPVRAALSSPYNVFGRLNAVLELFGRAKPAVTAINTREHRRNGRLFCWIRESIEAGTAGCFCVSDSTNSQPGGALRSVALPHRRSCGTLWSNFKNTTFPNAYSSSSWIFACYLCNTSPKTAGTAPFQGGPLLRDYDCWAMVVEATEGGIPRSSRLGVSLKSLAFMRECPKARGDRAVSGDQGNQPCGVTYTTGPEPSLESKTWRFYEHD